MVPVIVMLVIIVFFIFGDWSLNRVLNTVIQFVEDIVAVVRDVLENARRKEQ